jgi:hypothetical protein
MFSETELPAVPELSVTCTPGMRRMASPMLAAPLASMRWRSTTVRAPAKLLTLSCRPVPSQLPETWMLSSVVALSWAKARVAGSRHRARAAARGRRAGCRAWMGIGAQEGRK